jgi:hypothetical protein
LNRSTSQPFDTFNLSPSYRIPPSRPYTANSQRSDRYVSHNNSILIIPPPMKKEYLNQATNTDICNDDLSSTAQDITFKSTSQQKNRNYNHIIQFNPNNEICLKSQNFIQILKNSKNPLLDLYQVFLFLFIF